jgi:hypothetical protein
MAQNFIQKILNEREDIKGKYCLTKQNSISLDFDNPKSVKMDLEKMHNDQKKKCKFVSTANFITSGGFLVPVTPKIKLRMLANRNQVTNITSESVYKKNKNSIDKENEKSHMISNLFRVSKLEEEEEKLQNSLTEFLELSGTKSTPFCTNRKFESSCRNSSGVEQSESGLRSPENRSGENEQERGQLQVLRESIADSSSSSSNEGETGEMLQVRNVEQTRRNALVESYGSCSSSSESDSDSEASIFEGSLGQKEEKKVLRTPEQNCEQKKLNKNDTFGDNLNIQKMKEENDNDKEEQEQRERIGSQCVSIQRKIENRERSEPSQKRSRHSSDTSVSFLRLKNLKIFEGMQETSLKDIVGEMSPQKGQSIRKESWSTQHFPEQSNSHQTSAYKLNRVNTLAQRHSESKNIDDMEKKLRRAACSVCDKPLDDSQTVAGFNICEHFFHEECLFELIEQTEYEEREEEEKEVGENDPKTSPIFCPKCHQFGQFLL